VFDVEEDEDDLVKGLEGLALVPASSANSKEEGEPEKKSKKGSRKASKKRT
jgi:hypothetical protein